MYWKAPLRKASLVGASLLAGAAFAGVMSDFIADRAARQAFAAISTSVGPLTAERVVADRSGGMRLAGLHWRCAGGAIHIGALTLVSAAPKVLSIGAARADSATASAENVTIETPLATYRIKRIDLSGAALSTADLAQLLDAKNPAPIAQRLARFSAAAITIPELIAEMKFGPVAQKIVYHDISLTGVVKGKIAAASVEGASFSVSDAEGGGAQGAYGHMNAMAIDLVQAARIMTESGAGAEERKATLYESFSIDGFYFSGGKARIELDVKTLAGRGIRGRPLRQPWVDDKDNDRTPLERQKRAMLLFADLLDAFDVDELEATDLRLSTREDGKPIGLAIGRIAIGQFSGAKFDKIGVEKLAFAAEKAKIRVADFTFRGLDLKNLQDGFAGSASTDPAAAAKAKSAIPSAVDNIIFNKIDFDIVDKENAETSFKADRFELRGSHPQDGAPARVDVALDHLTFALGQAEGGSLKDLGEMGYSQLDLSSRVEIAFDETKRELAIGALSLEGAGMGKVNVSGLFTNVTKELLSPDRVIATAAAVGAILQKVDLRVENAGLFEKAIGLQAKNQNKSPDEVRQGYVTGAAVLLPALLENGPAARAIGAALAKFVAKPQSFHLVAVAPNGLGAADLTLLQTPGALLKKLEIEASANQ